ncbi:MAG: SEC-C metal-binding domain-containing protein [Chloroflexota bacterium]|nr:SEC-C metal-binding domain-containing protein [Chloroflexota bacterium]
MILELARYDAELERAFAAAGRNDPCPCGSGLKFKRCHGRRGGG